MYPMRDLVHEVLEMISPDFQEPDWPYLTFDTLMNQIQLKIDMLESVEHQPETTSFEKSKLTNLRQVVQIVSEW